jgi:hypothetical protein
MFVNSKGLGGVDIIAEIKLKINFIVPNNE